MSEVDEWQAVTGVHLLKWINFQLGEVLDFLKAPYYVWCANQGFPSGQVKSDSLLWCGFMGLDDCGMKC